MGILAGTQRLAGAILTTGSVELVDDITTAYQRSQVLLTAHRLRLFEALQEGPRTSDDLAGVLEADRRAIRILCHALVAIGLLQKRDAQFALATPAADCLLPTSPHSKYAMLSQTVRSFEQWSQLYETVKTGRPSRPPETNTRERDFARAMADVGRVTAGMTADMLDLSAVSTVLDVGAGPGLYGIEFARRRPKSTVVLLDGAETLEVAKQYVLQAGLTDRIECRVGDFFQDDLGGPYDLVFISNVIHLLSGDACQQLIARCVDVLSRAGQLVVKDFLMDADQVSPPGAALFAVTMLLNTEGGMCHGVSDIEQWFLHAGARLEAVRDITPKSRLAIGVRVGP